MKYQIFFKHNKATGKIICTHYDACLRKNVHIEHATVSKIDLEKLDERMREMNWEEVSQYKISSEFNVSDKET